MVRGEALLGKVECQHLSRCYCVYFVVMMSTQNSESSRKRKSAKPQKSDQVKRRLPLNEIEVMESFHKDESQSGEQNTAKRNRGRPKGHKNKYPSWSSLQISSASDGKWQSNIPTSSQCPKELDNEYPKGEKESTTKALCSSPVKGELQCGEQNTAKGKRGRPKGSKNKYPSWFALQNRTPGAPKMGRGRPRKPVETNGTVVPKRPRGRPKGSLNKVPSAKKLAVSMGSSCVQKRGRPRKHLLHLPTLTPKRPRGRPKIVRISSAGPNDVLAASMGSLCVQKRGRPRKHLLHLPTLTPKRPRGRPKIVRISSAGPNDVVRSIEINQ
ncbi:uncharacterized protein LOC100137644 isoform X2 [Xenopus laevis]|uniref:Uncharacterized protein n=2 Tax=Xenopus laevis TaxID=8355 RepID=A0A974C8F0_XENLA|nr:uncharacterized protein LOC100137644 isoform X2 [Xenopus laevis]OCT67830.1 hypothetical protein XELAEV_18039134mg [Xenopus laevis]